VTWVVTATRRSDGLCLPAAGVDWRDPAQNACIGSGHDLVETLDYQDGRFDPASREFRGFRRVERRMMEAAGTPANRLVAYFGQDDLTRGRLLQTEAYANMTKVQSEIMTWAVQPQDATRTQVWLQKSARETTDLQTDGSRHYVETTNDPPDGFGNITRTATGGLDVATHVVTSAEYAVPSGSTYAVNDRPAKVTVTNASGAVLDEKWFHYDGSGANGMANGSIKQGRLKRIRSRLNATTANGPEVKTAYDSYGNPTEVTDPNGNDTNSDYDDGTGTYLHPYRVTNEFDHTTTTFTDYFHGLPKLVTDANSQNTWYDYDAAGRRTCVALPPDTLSHCTTASEWYFAPPPTPGTATSLSWVKVSIRQDPPTEGQPAPPPLVTQQFFDPLGRSRHTDVTRIVEGGVGSDVRTNKTEYDAGGRVAKVYSPHLASATPPVNDAMRFDYLLNGSGVIDPLGRVHRTTYSDGTYTEAEYRGAVTRAYDGERQYTEQTVDAFGRAVEQRTYDGATLYSTTIRAYDGVGRLLSTTVNGVTLATTTYDALGRKTRPPTRTRAPGLMATTALATYCGRTIPTRITMSSTATTRSTAQNCAAP